MFKIVLFFAIATSIIMIAWFAIADVKVNQGQIYSTKDFQEYQIISVDTNRDKTPDIWEQRSFRYRKNGKFKTGDTVIVKTRTMLFGYTEISIY
jgi:hypothetical protein